MASFWERAVYSVERMFSLYEGCQKSSWTPMIEASNEPDFDIHSYLS